MNIKTSILQRVLPAGALAFMIIAAVAYQKGIYDITFIKRPETQSASEILSVDTETLDETLSDETLPVDIGKDTVIIQERDPVTEFLNSLKPTSELLASEFAITSEEFRDNFVLSLIGADVPLSNEFSKRSRIVEGYVRIPDDTYNTYHTETAELTEDIPTAEAYMDYILVDNGTTTDVYENNGNLLLSGLDTSVYVPAYTRDKSDNALFKAKEPSRYYPKNLITNYYFIKADGTLQKSSYNDESDGRGLYVNYPTSFGKTDTALYRYYNKTDELYGYGSANGNMQTEYIYSSAYNYSERLACTVEEDGLMYFLNENLITKISGSVQIFKNYNSAKRRLLREYVMPDTYGEESLGFFYFDHGLVRVRCQIVDAYHWIEREKRYTASDNDILIRTDGTEFPLPSEYELMSYSNGMILLQKDGNFGFLDYTGKWILEPVYKDAKPFYEGLAVVSDGEKYGMINTNGEFVIPTVFDYIGSASGGIICAWSENHGWALINKLSPTAG